MSTTSCGLHVHISKSSFLDSENSLKNPFKPALKNSKPGTAGMATWKLRVGKFIAFLNATENQSLLYSLSGRKENSYARRLNVGSRNSFGYHKGIGVAKSIQLKKGYSGFGSDHNSARRFIVNTTNADTLEVRILDSTTDKAALFRRLEFCHALVEFVKVCTPRQLTFDHFIDFLCDEKRIAGHNKTYRHLLSWFATKRLVKVNRKRSLKTGKLITTYSKLPKLPPQPASSTTTTATTTTPFLNINNNSNP